ncbi:MAG: glycosyltransferase family 2 protein [Planctomycetia bacterium]|nr:glycosyltransferase family 2 protein [Planctomycetia bacterium]
MPRSLSLILPVYNAQESLPAMLAELLDLLPELTNRFEVQLIDDGSLDATMEIASDLVANYPQVRLLAHPARLGTRIAMETGLRHSTGEWVLYRDADCVLDLQGIAKMWRQTGEFDCLLGRRAAGTPLGWIPRMPSRQDAIAPEHDGMIMAKRAVFGQWMLSPSQQTFETHLVRRGIAWKALDLRVRPANPAAEAIRSLAAQRTLRKGELVGAGTHAGSPMRHEHEPNYLRKIADFALGE